MPISAKQAKENNDLENKSKVGRIPVRFHGEFFSAADGKVVHHPEKGHALGGGGSVPDKTVIRLGWMGEIFTAKVGDVLKNEAGEDMPEAGYQHHRRDLLTNTGRTHKYIIESEADAKIRKDHEAEEAKKAKEAEEAAEKAKA